MTPATLIRSNDGLKIDVEVNLEWSLTQLKVFLKESTPLLRLEKEKGKTSEIGIPRIFHLGQEWNDKDKTVNALGLGKHDNYHLHITVVKSLDNTSLPSPSTDHQHYPEYLHDVIEPQDIASDVYSLSTEYGDDDFPDDDSTDSSDSESSDSESESIQEEGTSNCDYSDSEYYIPSSLIPSSNIRRKIKRRRTS